jgi:hypothetical protein
MPELAISQFCMTAEKDIKRHQKQDLLNQSSNFMGRAKSTHNQECRSILSQFLSKRHSKSGR